VGAMAPPPALRLMSTTPRAWPLASTTGPPESPIWMGLVMMVRYRVGCLSGWPVSPITPVRTDGDGLRKYYETVAFRFPIDVAVGRGALCPFDAVGFTLPIKFGGVRSTEDGWESQSAGDLLKSANALEVVYEKWVQFAADRLTVAFTASVDQAHASAEYFRDRFVESAAVDGTTPKEERRRILQAFKAGEIRVVWNCAVWTEGADFPAANCVMMVCPTRSDLAYVQKMGRGLRVMEGKENCLIMDFAPMDGRDVVFAGDVLGMPRDVKKALDAAERSGVLGAFSMSRQGYLTRVDPSEVVMRFLDLIKRDTLAWAVEGSLAVATLSDSVMLGIVLPDFARMERGEKIKAEGRYPWPTEKEALLDWVSDYHLYLVRKEPWWKAEYAGEFGTEDDAYQTARNLADQFIDPRLAAKSRKWRRAAPSAGQITFMKRLGLDAAPELTKGQASQMISRALCKRAVDEAASELETDIVRGAELQHVETKE